ncbi:putative RNA-binding protein [Monoraphidium neglectum]|uniref:Putative RNA-binding protein n=1 Tax=Monoraphidium neglectum TaxID=145388 RepID=A0A0D2ME29_9CHLO|nr:putative RNA-binding protein [Monoraphidium neglectum]KIY99006.1 putative RNA-binding protein [Monoraphidium neglectum]|eukprot:XP_013898026.1 putative RNA-binding protein [Monoraphidium neglectum]
MADTFGRERRKIFLGGLSWETNEDKLKEHFGKYGVIQEVIVMRDRVTGKPRGFGFITFDTEEAAQRACEDDHTLDGRTIDAKPSVPQDSQQRPRSKKIFVGGLAPETTPEQFKLYFERYGKVVEAQIMVDHTSNRSRGFGFITFEEEASVHRVFNAGPMHELAGKRVEVKSATPKGSGPQGRGGGVALAPGGGAGRGAMGVLGAAASGGVYAGPAGGYGMGGYMAPGYMVPAGYGGFLPYHPTAFPAGMMMGGFAYPGYGPPAGYPAHPVYGPAAMRPLLPQPQAQLSPGAPHPLQRGGGGARGGGRGLPQLPREQSLPGAVLTQPSWSEQQLQQQALQAQQQPVPRQQAPRQQYAPQQPQQPQQQQPQQQQQPPPQQPPPQQQQQQQQSSAADN